MSLHDEFEALKHVPHELAAWVRSLIRRVDPNDATSELSSGVEGNIDMDNSSSVAVAVAEVAPVVAASAAEGQEHA